MDVIEVYLEGKVDVWFQGVKLEKCRITWEEFNKLVCQMFGERGFLDTVEEFNKLQQVGTMLSY